MKGRWIIHELTFGPSNLRYNQMLSLPNNTLAVLKIGCTCQYLPKSYQKVGDYSVIFNAGKDRFNEAYFTDMLTSNSLEFYNSGRKREFLDFPLDIIKSDMQIIVNSVPVPREYVMKVYIKISIP